MRNLRFRTFILIQGHSLNGGTEFKYMCVTRTLKLILCGIKSTDLQNEEIREDKTGRTW